MKNSSNDYFVRQACADILKNKLLAEAGEAKTDREKELLEVLEFIVHHKWDESAWLVDEVSARLYPKG